MYKEESKFKGTTDVVHLLSILKDRITFDKIKNKVTKPLTDLKIGAYYGCLLLRPKELAIDDYEDPSVMEELVDTLGGEGMFFLTG